MEGLRLPWAVCLAALLIITPTADAATAYPGYTFCASGATAYLLNMSSQTVHTWTASGKAQTCAYLLADGSALFPIENTSCTSPAHNGSYPNGRFQKIGWDGTILWDYYFCDSTARAGYDVKPMPNGNILVPADSSTVAKIFEIQPSGTSGGTVVWSYALPSTLTGSTTYINSVSYNPELDMILVDLQDPQRKLVVIDHSGSGSVVLTYTVGSSGRVHAAAWVTKYFLGTNIEVPDADKAAMRTNNLLVVYNGGDKVIEVGLASSNLVKSLSYAFDDHEGSVQRLPNGNTLVTPGNSKTITELNESGTAVATMTAPGSIQRAYRYGYSFPGVSRLLTNVLTVVSPHGTPSPSDSTTNAYGTLIAATVTGYETNVGNSLFACGGWTLSGAKATNGTTSGTTTNVALWMTNNVTLTWQWKSNYWLTTATSGNGTLSLKGGAAGWNASTSSVAIIATASSSSHFAAWSGDTNGCTIASTQISVPMTQVRTITGNFAVDTTTSQVLTVVSAHGSPSPAGVTTNVNGTVVVATVAASETEVGNVQYVSSGWTLVGGVATNGAASGTGTSVVLVLTNNTTLTWLWSTNWWLALATNGSGVVSVSGGEAGWNGAGASVTLTALPESGWHLSGWSGDTNGCSIASTQVTVPMTQARTVVANFTIVPAEIWLSINRDNADASLVWITATNLPLGATGTLLSAASLVGGNWQTSAPFVISATATNWAVPLTASNAFYRLQLD